MQTGFLHLIPAKIFLKELLTLKWVEQSTVTCPVVTFGQQWITYKMMAYKIIMEVKFLSPSDILAITSFRQHIIQKLTIVL